MRQPDLAIRDWTRVAEDLDSSGGAVLDGILTPEECRSFRDLYEDGPERFRKSVDMERYRFGQGEYRYLAKPHPPMIDVLRESLYMHLVPVARRWWTQLRREAPWPDTLDEWTRRCHDAGQSSSSVIILKYREGDWNALHRDLFGDAIFPLQMVINLSDAGQDYSGGEFMLVEQRPRAQSRGTVFPMKQGSGCIFTTRDRPIRSARGWSTAPIRHGVSTVTTGERYTLGLLLHEASK